MKSILAVQEIKAENFTPETVMEQTIGQQRYNVFGEPATFTGNPAAEDWETPLKKRKAELA